MDMTLLDKLQSDGDSVEIGDGRTLKLMFRPDEESFENIGDHGEVYGETPRMAATFDAEIVAIHSGDPASTRSPRVPLGRLPAGGDGVGLW